MAPGKHRPSIATGVLMLLDLYTSALDPEDESLLSQLEAEAQGRDPSLSDTCWSGGRSFMVCCMLDGTGKLVHSDCWSDMQAPSPEECCMSVLRAFVNGTFQNLFDQKRYSLTATLSLRLSQRYLPTERDDTSWYLARLEGAFLAGAHLHHVALENEAFAMMNWKELAQRHFGVAPSDDDLGEALKKNNWKLMSAWGLAVLDHLQDADGPNDVPTADTGNRDRDGLLQTLSTIQRPGMSCTAHELMSTWSPRLLRYFEEYAEQPAYSAFTPSLRRHGSFDNFEVLGQAHEVNPSLVMLLHDTVEPSAGTPWRAEVERQGPGGPILSQAYVFSVFVLANMYSDMMKSAWEFGSTDLEVFEVGGGSGGLAWLAAHLSAFSPDHPELGFRTWTIFDIPHVAALQMWYLNKTLPVSCTLERICGAGLSAGSSTGAALELSPPPAGGGLVRLVDTSAREFWLYGQRMYDRSDPARSARRRVRVLVASWSWSETDASEFLWYANHVLSLCDFAIYTYSTWWDQNSTTRWKLDVITEQMEPMLGIVIQNGNEITKLFRRRE